MGVTIVEDSNQFSTENVTGLPLITEVDQFFFNTIHINALQLTLM
jgi:hypothetical protein